MKFKFISLYYNYALGLRMLPLQIMSMLNQEPFFYTNLTKMAKRTPKQHSDIQYVSNPIRVVVMIDGGFFLKRYNKMYNKFKKNTAKTVVEDMYKLAHSHVGVENYLYRIFYYDCLPLDKKVHNPVTGKCIDLSKSPEAKFKKEFIEELKRKRKVAIRVGNTLSSNDWCFTSKTTKDIIAGKKVIEDLTENDVRLGIRQKGIDMRIGIDITSLAIKKHIDKIVLISGDSDFVPAAKLARREGIDFVLDPMYAQHINSSLFEHIDGLQSYPLYKNRTTTIKKSTHIKEEAK